MYYEVIMLASKPVRYNVACFTLCSRTPHAIEGRDVRFYCIRFKAAHDATVRLGAGLCGTVRCAAVRGGSVRFAVTFGSNRFKPHRRVPAL